MRIAMPVESKSIDDLIYPSFGRTPLFVILDTASNKQEFLDNSAAAGQGGAGIKASQMLADNQVEAVITYRLGENAADVLNAAGIKIYQAKEIPVKENAAKCVNGELPLLTDIHPGFHNHGGAR